MFDIFNENDEEVPDGTADLDPEVVDPSEAEALEEMGLAGEDTGATPDAESESDPESDRDSGNEPTVIELEARIEDLEDQLDSAESSLRAVRDSQSEISEDIEEMNDTVRRLMGMYDRITAENNPFVDGPEGNPGPRDGDGDGDGDGGPARPRGGPEKPSVDGNGSSPDEDDPFVSLEELREDTELGDQGGNDELDDDADNPTGGPHGDESPTLTSIPDGYAGDVLVMEWLSVLMAESGPSGALRAVEHYVDAGWISPALKDRLVDIIGGPALDTSVDPTQFPRGPTAEDHAMSHDYIRVLAHLQDL